MTGQEFNKEFAKKIETTYIGKVGNEDWKKHILSNMHKLSDEALDSMIYNEESHGWRWSPEVKKAVMNTLAERAMMHE